MSNSEPLDGKQMQLIEQWYKLSTETPDAYLKFMTKWIAFNAICYHLYFPDAVSDRVNIEGNKATFRKIKATLAQEPGQRSVPATANSKENRLNIELNFPEKLRLRIEEKYTEDRIFDAFAKDKANQDRLGTNEAVLKPLFEQLQQALRKKDANGHPVFYVMNMAKSREYNEQSGVEELAKRNIIVRCHEYSLPVIKDVLYQVRCNIFHGEKTPGDVNDDRIVKAALPMLDKVLRYMMKDLGLYLPA